MCGQPVGVGVAGWVAVLWVMAPVEYPVAVILRARLLATVCAGQVKLAAEAAVVAALGQQCGYERGAFAPFFVSVHAAAYVGGIAACKKAGPAGRADWALAEGVGKGDALLDEAIQIGSVDMGIAKGMNGVEPLLVCAEPENVGTIVFHRRASFVRSSFSVMIPFAGEIKI